jgi:recombination protein RecR
MPTIGRKSAHRLAFHILKGSPDQARELGEALIHLHENVHFCKKCFYLTEGDLCSICLDGRRDQQTICVVEEPSDVATFERGGIYRGLYHVLLGHISPLRGIMPEDLKISELLNRVRSSGESISEVILAMNPNVDGDATALYLSRQLEAMGIKSTRLGLGLPMGAALEYADDLTLSKALESRKNY